MSCRLSTNESLTPAQFDSIACANCFYFIYMVASPYVTHYYTQRCEAGLLICRDPFQPGCNCDNPHAVYNLPEFTVNRSVASSFIRLLFVRFILSTIRCLLFSCSRVVFILLVATIKLPRLIGFHTR
ncbi:unnamed protein product [Heligmosomoides polygyrus]|uniref:Uncharacterized protein n=1 Tax=Heligmosomoides polygyrus TaxID=6339 RepID=A0A183FSV2_HELPZ|nr:unnamed protein product [Heligmosomoides polygyrus]